MFSETLDKHDTSRSALNGALIELPDSRFRSKTTRYRRNFYIHWSEMILPSFSSAPSRTQVPWELINILLYTTRVVWGTIPPQWAPRGFVNYCNRLESLGIANDCVWSRIGSVYRTRTLSPRPRGTKEKFSVRKQRCGHIVESCAIKNTFLLSKYSCDLEEHSLI